MCTSPDRSVEVAESLRVASKDALRIGALREQWCSGQSVFFSSLILNN